MVGNIKVNVLLENRKTKILENKTFDIAFNNTIPLNEDVKEENVDVDYILKVPSVYLDKSSIITSFGLDVIARIEDDCSLSQALEIYSEPIDEEDFNSMYIYIVKKGDTLWDIAKKYKTTVAKIANINNIENENNISVGEKLLLIR